MGKVDIFEIKVETGSPVQSGGSVSGEVLLRIKKDIDIARVMVYLYGGGQVEFQDGQGSTPSSRVTTFEDHETYVRLAQMVFSKSAQRGPVTRVCRNELYKFRFEFRLPKDIPSSFMTVIYYKLTAFLDCGGKSHETTKPLVVINDLDLNAYAGRLPLLEPIDAWTPVRSKLDSGLVSARLVTSKRGFAIGEVICMQIEIYNNSRAKLENISACLVQRGTLKAYSQAGLQCRRVQRLLVRHLPLGKLRNAERLVIDDAKISVPWAVTSDTERLCRLIEIEYYLQVTTSTPLLSALTGAPLSQVVCIGPDFRKSEMVSVLVEEPVAIGMRALRGAPEPPAAQDVGTEPPGASAMPTAPPADGADLTMFTMVPSAPPSYDEAMNHEKAPLGRSNSAASSDEMN